ncbi:uncharacterized protein METZ01_LOCUS174850 [marine metagenome]|uniref:Uncharacterized protein n=1 Tax=marine metagenome TaxID=408172 RepID=A0A382C7G1_9ZZZZ|tara:strand:+ start:827 stop:1024 length:198 start_codon:yes stop_codon:yes gene_type:complete
MAGIDVSDKDPFAHADDEPKDNISFFGFIFRAAYRYIRIGVIMYLFIALIYYFVFGGSILDYINI